MTDSAETERRKIVVGVDGSDTSKAALAWAIRQAALTGAPLEVVISWDYPINYGWMIAVPENLDFAADAAAELDEIIEETVGIDGGAVDITKKVIHNHPALALMQEAQDAALVVVGSRGHGEFTGMLLGSVSEHLATHAPCPVLILRDRSHGQ
jgi:nucleotide-binding universal stress UspA family protein